MRESIYESFERRINYLQRKPFRSRLAREYIEDMKRAIETSYVGMKGMNCEIENIYNWLRYVALFQVERNNRLFDEVNETKGRVDAEYYWAMIKESNYVIDKFYEMMMLIFMHLFYGKEICDGNDKK